MKTLGLASYGFNPPKTIEKQGEEIVVNTLDVKIDKLTLLTAKKDFDAIEKKIEDGLSLTPREELLSPAIKEFKQFQSMLKDINDKKIIEDWLYQKSKNFKIKKNKLMVEISKTKFLTIGICGYMYFAKLKFIDALQNASMILGGMGPVDQMPTNSAKCFASLYSLFSGIILISTVVILFSPIVHRIMHKFHLETDNDKL